MRLGMESPSSPQAPARHGAFIAARSSALSPIDVDGDDATSPARSVNDLETLSSPSTRPSLLNISPATSNNNNTGITRRPLELYYDSSDSEEKKSEPKDQDEPSDNKKLNFFFKMATPPKPSRRETTTISRQSSHSSSARSSPMRDDLHEVISAARTIICRQKFDRCELEFGQDTVQLTIWKDGRRRWRGGVKYAHVKRFCFSRVDHPPYILLLQLDNNRGRSEFATFYDPIYARCCQHKEQTTPEVYGVIFYFDDAMDYTRCQSMGDSIPKLTQFFREKLTENEVLEYTSRDSSTKLGPPRRVELRSSSSSHVEMKSLTSAVGDKVRRGLNSVASFFSPAPRSPVLEENHPVVVKDHGNSMRGQTLDLSRESNGVLHADVGEGKTPISINDSSRERGPGADSGVETVIIDQSTQPDRRDVPVLSSALEKEEKESDKIMTRKRAAESRREDEKVKRRKLETRRNEVLLTYPYDGSDTSGRISVTLGDVDRLAPGEFLNDNIVDFFLRQVWNGFYWRHLLPWQQQQTHFFTSHFFTQLNGTNGAHELANADPDERFARVARWTHKETNLFSKRFLFFPINDSFHWSVAVFCNPGSAIIKKRRKVRRFRRLDKTDVVDLVDEDGGKSEGSLGTGDDAVEEVEEEELESCREDRLANPPCLLFLDSLRCHRKKKFTKMLRNYLECEWKARYAVTATNVKQKTEGGVYEEESLVTSFDSESIGLVDPNMPMQSNSSDCGVFLLMYAASIVRLFPAGVTSEDLENNLASALKPDMFRDEHVLEFREYLHQLLFCLQYLERNGLPEEKVKDEDLEFFTID
ncbi:Sentrin-specific protease 7 [Phytophthora citrophthora]|uniref:Sentrin-specific protease 7 n=1 Tax=Phytophthora citrophthora TaxID=4793 RepID=A0AAD9GU57_9STRA|nr:Sentrin-specific protease 7 [Phytophthora citrophthora]